MPNLKGLGQFVRFDLRAFLADKKLVLTSVSEWHDFQSKELLGSKAEVTIVEDKTEYRAKGGAQISNLYNKLVIKVPGTVNIAIGTEVEIVGGEATVYGDYRNMLSIKAASIRPVTAATNGGKQ